VYRPENADLILLVRRGRVAGTTLSGSVSVPGERQTGPRTTATAVPSITPTMEVGMPDDMLAVYDAKRGLNSPPYWEHMQRDGLKAPKLDLLKTFRDDVENAAAAPPRVSHPRHD